jgi:hypothetical protein
MIGYVLLAIVSYLMIPLAIDFTWWLASLLIISFILSVYGFFYSVPQK